MVPSTPAPDPPGPEDSPSQGSKAIHSDIETLTTLLRHVGQLQQTKTPERELHEALRELGGKYRSLLENIPDIIYSLDHTGKILTINRAVRAYGYTPEEVVGRNLSEFIHPEDRDRLTPICLGMGAAGQGYLRSGSFRALAKSGEVCWFQAYFFLHSDPEGRSARQEGVCRDITESVRNETRLIRVQEALEEQVRIRTHELLQANLELQKEIEERRATERALREREAELETEKANLQEANTALKVLLKRREVDKKDLEEQIQYNLKKLVIPYLEKLQRLYADERLRSYLSIIETNLGDLTGGFSRRLSLEFHGLSAAELKIANFIRQGRKNREIALLLNISIRTVESSRQSIRRKLNLTRQKKNLRTFLMNIA